MLKPEEPTIFNVFSEESNRLDYEKEEEMKTLFKESMQILHFSENSKDYC